MQSLVMAVVGVAMMVLGYFLYSSFLSKRVFKLSPDYETPSHKYQDGVDYVPSNKWVLWGHHFTSVAGAAPIVGLPLPSSGVGYPPSCGSRSAPFSSPACMIWVRCGHQPATKAAPSAHCRAAILAVRAGSYS